MQQLRLRSARYRVNDGGGTEFGEEWQQSFVHLGIVRTNLHIVKNWDVLLEGRVMHMPEADTTDYGALTALYRHVRAIFSTFTRPARGSRRHRPAGSSRRGSCPGRST